MKRYNDDTESLVIYSVSEGHMIGKKPRMKLLEGELMLGGRVISEFKRNSKSKRRRRQMVGGRR